MVRGLDTFKKYFEQFTGNYVIIGGTACDMIIDEAGFTPRATKDIDGSKEDSKKLRKHKGDIFRLAVMLAENDEYELPASIKADMQEFSDAIASDLPDKAMFKEMGLSNINSEEVYEQLLKSFKLKN